MFTRSIMKKFAFGLLLLSALSLILVGCGKKRATVDVDITDQGPPNEQQTPPSTTPPPNNDGGNNEVNAPINSNIIKFLNINLVGGEPPLQKNEGIFYFTKTQHPPEVASSFRYDTHNGWLVQLNDPAYKGYKIKVQQIKRVGNIFDITVRLQPGGDITKPAFGFFEVGIFDMPTHAKFRIYNDAGQKLWPKF